MTLIVATSEEPSVEPTTVATSPISGCCLRIVSIVRTIESVWSSELPEAVWIDEVELRPLAVRGSARPDDGEEIGAEEEDDGRDRDHGLAVVQGPAQEGPVVVAQLVVEQSDQVLEARRQRFLAVPLGSS